MSIAIFLLAPTVLHMLKKYEKMVMWSKRKKYLITVLAIVLGFLCASHIVSAQQPQDPCRSLPGGTGNVLQHLCV